jgi:DNA segregation ATPase FtsK/SpoIIIE, S-DNA-T family
MIYLKDILLSDEMKQLDKPLTIGLGKDISGNPLVADLAKMPHLLIAGATGSGKSVCINTLIVSLLLRTTPAELRLVLIDPKRVELAGYEGIPHLIGDVVTEPDDALGTMHWAVREMEKRYEMLQDLTVRDINSYNQKLKDDKTGEFKDFSPLPFIVIVVDEFADLIMTAGRDIELPITRLAQMARAVGIHLILATQRPSIKVITGIIKANFPARIAFQVSSKVDSRVILDMMGAERLLGQGDMLFVPPGKAIPDRIHGAFVSDVEITKLCEYLKDQPKPKSELFITSGEKGGLQKFEYDDELFPDAARIVISANMASVSMLQRHFKIGYARAGRLIDMLEQAGIIGPHLGSKSRDVLASESDLDVYGL